MLVATQYAVEYFGDRGLYTLAGIMGLADIDPFVMSLTQSGPTVGSLGIAANAILIAAASNNFMKGIYAYFLSSEKSRIQSSVFMLLLAILGLIPVFWKL